MKKNKIEIIKIINKKNKDLVFFSKGKDIMIMRAMNKDWSKILFGTDIKLCGNCKKQEALERFIRQSEYKNKKYEEEQN